MIILAPIGWLYGLIMRARNALYDRGILRSYDLGAKTISIGNITTGGTGKTPLVALVAEILAANGKKVCILTRGYGRLNENERVLVSDGETVLADAETGGDEPVDLARKLLGKAIVVADADRVAAAKWATSKFDITVFLLDDAFQHRRAKRDLDLVCIDANNPFGNGSVLPAGLLREFPSGIDRADAVIIARSGQPENTEALEFRLRKSNSAAGIFKASIPITKIVTFEEFHTETQSSQRDSPQKVFAFSGLANNENFFSSLEAFGCHLNGTNSFGDHQLYTQNDIEKLEDMARSQSAQCLITTAKDAVKLKGMKFSIPCFVAEIETVIDDPNRFRDLVLSA